jgi:hypothetical protein
MGKMAASSKFTATWIGLERKRRLHWLYMLPIMR